MLNEYYVIVDLKNLTYMKDGEGVNLKEANKFDTLKQAENEIEKYDDDFNGVIYRVKEYTTIELEKAYQKGEKR